MNNVIKLLIYLLVALLLVSWLITVGKSCTNGPSNSMEETPISTVDRADSARDLMAELEEDSTDFSQELESILDEEEQNAQKQDDSEGIDYTSYEEESAKPAPEPKSTQNSGSSEAQKPANTTTRNRTVSSTSGPGKYLVVAGSYIVPGNANQQRDKLLKLGYDAEVVSFELSEYHAVLAGRYNDYNQAKATVNSLSGDGVDSYVKTRTR